ncbi:hypothetical protein ACJMK2_016410 [Sinanodonta woodiana]|uniref:Uncharacterized protein n=1 Tax=Sinanodonta woodiana TaxID=1069815 RepID=A0ABD3UTI3_SINWO
MDVEEWKKKFKERWDERRNHVIFEGNGGIIYPSTFTPQYSTSEKPMSSIRQPSPASRGRRHNHNSKDAEFIIKIVGLTIASLLAFAIIAFIIVWICKQRLNNEKKRTSFKSPLQRKDTQHIYAEIESLTKSDIESSSKISDAVPQPTTMQTRLSGLRYIFNQIFHLLCANSRRSKTNDSNFVSKHPQSVRFPPLPPIPDISSGNHTGKRRAERQQLSSVPCPKMEWHVSSILSDALVDICERKNVYNPLNREADPASYDHLKLVEIDEVSPVLPHDYFELEKEKKGNQQLEDIGCHPYLILAKEEGNREKEDKPNPTEREDVDKGDCTTKSATIHYICHEEKSDIDKDHIVFVLKRAACPVCLNQVKVSNTPFEDNLYQPAENSSSQHHINSEFTC